MSAENLLEDTDVVPAALPSFASFGGRYEATHHRPLGANGLLFCISVDMCFYHDVTVFQGRNIFMLLS